MQNLWHFDHLQSSPADTPKFLRHSQCLVSILFDF